jgi:hypothetical protein
LSHRAITFAISDLATGRRLALAVVCPEARYASIAWPGAERLDRRHATPRHWKQIELDLQLGLPSGPLDATSWMVDVLLDANRRRSLVVQYVSVLPVEVVRAETASTVLDALLRSQDPAAAAAKTSN